MAFLMLLHEKMRLQRKVNKLTYKQLRASNKKERITKNIERLQKYYSKKSDNLQKQAQMLQSQATVFFQNQMGLGTYNQAFNPFNMNAGGGVTSFVLNQMGAMLASGQIPKDKDNKYAAIDNARFQEMLQDYYVTGLQQTKDKDGNFLGDDQFGTDGKFTKDEVIAFKMAMSQAQNNQAQAQGVCQQMTTQYQSNISVWLEAQQAQLEEEQNAVLLPLQSEETDMDLERESCEAQLADARARLENIKQACSQEIKDSAPTFGLG